MKQRITYFDIKVLIAFYDIWKRDAYPPTLREIMVKVGSESTSQILHTLLKLSKFCLIEAYKLKRGWLFYPNGLKSVIVNALGDQK